MTKQEQRSPSRSRLRVLRVVASAGPKSAPANQFLLGLRERVETTIVVFAGQRLEPPSGVIVLSANRSLGQAWRLVWNAAGGAPFDVVHLHAPLVGTIALVAILMRKPSLLRRTVYTFHQSFQNYSRVNRVLLCVCVTMAAAVVPCGESSVRSLPRWLRGIIAHKTRVIRNGADFDRIDRVLGDGEPDTLRYTAVVAARLRRLKRIDAVLDALARLPGWSLVVIGDGPEGPRLEQKVAALNLSDRVRFRGELPREDVYRELARSQVFLSLSRGEGLPVAPLEAAGCGAVPVLSDIAPHREIALALGTTDLLVDAGDAGDVDSVVRIMQQLQHMSRISCHALAEGVRRRARLEFAVDDMLRQYCELYGAIADGTFK